LCYVDCEWSFPAIALLWEAPVNPPWLGLLFELNNLPK
jgi:hypothetical protein